MAFVRRVDPAPSEMVQPADAERQVRPARLAASHGATRLIWSLGAFLALASIEAIVISYLFVFPTGLSEWTDPVVWVKTCVRLAAVAAIALTVVCWPQRQEIGRRFSHAALTRDNARPYLANGLAFAVLAVATIAFSWLAARAPDAAWLWFWPYCGLLLIAAAALACTVASPSFWIGFARECRPQIATALACAIAGILELGLLGNPVRGGMAVVPL